MQIFQPILSAGNTGNTNEAYPAVGKMQPHPGGKTLPVTVVTGDGKTLKMAIGKQPFEVHAGQRCQGMMGNHGSQPTVGKLRPQRLQGDIASA